MRLIPLRFVPAVIAAVFCLAWVGPSAQAASFPCTSFVHQLRVGKTGEQRAAANVKKFRRAAAEHAKHDNTRQFVSGDLSQMEFWRGDLRYLTALDHRIGQENCSRFNYAAVVRWIHHRAGHLLHERNVHDSRGTPAEDQKFEYAEGGLRALGPNKVKIVRMAEAHGINVDP